MSLWSFLLRLSDNPWCCLSFSGLQCKVVWLWASQGWTWRRQDTCFHSGDGNLWLCSTWICDDWWAFCPFLLDSPWTGSGTRYWLRSFICRLCRFWCGLGPRCKQFFEFIMTSCWIFLLVIIHRQSTAAMFMYVHTWTLWRLKSIGWGFWHQEKSILSSLWPVAGCCINAFATSKENQQYSSMSIHESFGAEVLWSRFLQTETNN